MSETKVPCDFEDPETLKDILELLDKLVTASSVSSPVLGILENEAQKYFNVTEDSDSDGLTSSLGTVFTNAQSIRGSIISDTGTYQKYSSLDSHEGHDCVPNALKKFLPQAYAALLFMLFNCDSGMTKYSLGAWRDQNVNESGLSSQDLFNWLTKEKTILRTGTKPLTPGLISRGFSDLSSNTGQDVATEIKNIITHNTPEAFQSVLLYLLPLCEWNDALLGHALCFLSMFCVTVQSPQKNFKGYSEELKDVCLGLSGSLTSFLNGSSQSHISAVSQSTSNVYNDVFKDESLDDYCDWLKQNLKHIIQSLTLMSGESKNWGPHSFEWGYTAGPFRFGFVPKTTGWMTHIDKNLPPVIKSLIESLEKLEKALQTSSAGATAGGVFTGLFGLGGAGAGAAYGLNLFGFKNLVTGFLK